MDIGTLLLDDVEDSNVVVSWDDDVLELAGAVLVVEEGATELPVPDSLKVSA